MMGVVSLSKIYSNVSGYLDAEIVGAPITEEIGIGSLTAMARVRDITTHTADAPVTYLEDGSFVQDHVILNPIELRIEGSVSDSHVFPDPDTDITPRYTAALATIEGYGVSKSVSQLQRIETMAAELDDRLSEADRIIADGKQLMSVFSPTTAAKGYREQFIDSLDKLYSSKALISITMPYRRFDNMLITSRVITRGNEREALDFTITARQIRIAQTTYSETSTAISNPSTGLEGQADDIQAKGSQEGAEVEASLLYEATSAIGKYFGL